MATVFRAQDLKHDRTVAIKVLKDDLARSVAAERFLQEIRIVAKLQHPHILTLLDSGEVDGTLYYVMPFVEGESLRGRLDRENELPLSDAVRILEEVADALAFAHQHGVVHRDIKPDNVLLSGRHALVADFGVSKALDAAMGPARVTTTGMAIGTPAYMAPEQAVGDGTADHRVDIYALGILGYEVLTGRPPFQGRTPQQVLSAKLAGRVPTVTQLRPTVPEAVSQVLMRCLEEHPADRWQTADELRQLLESVRTPSGETTPWGVEPATRGVGRGWKVAGGVVLGLLVLGAATWALWPGGPPENGLPAVPTLAVLPFENLSGDSTQAYLADAVAGELTAALAKISGIHVVSRTSAMRYKDERPPLPEIGRELRADLVMEGSVMEVGNRLRITPQLIVAATDHHMWSDSYDGDLSDVLPRLSEVARSVAAQVQVALTTEDEQRLSVAPTTSPQVMQAVLRARPLIEAETPTSIDQAIRLLNGALDLDPSFAPAWGLLAHAEFLQVSWFTGSEVGTKVIPQVEEAAHRALALDPGDVEAQIAMAGVSELRLRWDDALGVYEKILASDPSNTTAGIYLANVLEAMGRYSEAEAQARRTVTMDPLSPWAQLELANVFFESRRMDETLTQMRRSLEVDPSNFRLRAFVTAYLVGFGHCEGPGDWLPAELGIGGAVSEMERFLGSPEDADAGTLGAAVGILATCGQPDRARELYHRLQAIADTGYVPPLLLARARITVGDTTGVLDLLDEALTAEVAETRWITNGESFREVREAFRAAPRFEALVDRVGLPRSPLKWPTSTSTESGSR